jgi:hypothetical protein
MMRITATGNGQPEPPDYSVRKKRSGGTPAGAFLSLCLETRVRRVAFC